MKNFFHFIDIFTCILELDRGKIDLMIENVARSRRKAFHKINDSFLRNVLCETVWKLRTRSYSLLKRLLKRGGARKIVRERTGDEGSGAASWKLEESAEAFTFRLRKEKKKKKGEEITRSETMNFWSTDDKKPVWESHSTYLSRFLFAQFSLEEEEEEEESLVLLFLSYFYFAIVERDVRIDPSFHINFRSKEIEFHREQKIFSISYFFFKA